MGSGDYLPADKRETCRTISQGDGELDCGGSDSVSATFTLSDIPAGSAVAESNHSSNRLPPAAGSLISDNPPSLHSLISSARKNSTSSDDTATKIAVNEGGANSNAFNNSDDEYVDLERNVPPDCAATKRFLAAGGKNRRKSNRYSRQYESYQCCGCRCKKLKPHQIALIVIFSVLLSAALCVSSFYMFVPNQVRAIMNLPEMAPQYSISDLQNDSFQVHIAQNVYMYSPFYVRIDPFVLTVTVNSRQVGWMEGNSYEISPGLNITVNHTTRFIITDGPWLQQLGNSIISSLANQIPNRLSVVVATTLSVHSLGFHWQVPYVRATDLKMGDTSLSPSTFADKKKNSNSSPAPPLVSVQNWTMSGLNGVTLNLAFNNPLSLAVDLDEVKVDILKSSKNLGQAIIPDLSVGMGQNLLPISLYIKNFFNAVGFGVNFMGNAEEILQFQNITITSREPGVQLPWINGWFDGVSFSIPFSKSTLSQGRRRR